MKYLMALLLLTLTACSTVTPVKRTFPDVPAELKEACVDLNEVDASTTKLSEVVSVVVKNYGQYQDCKDKVDDWVTWYTKQKEIFDSVK
jgi:hypothetical protein